MERPGPPGGFGLLRPGYTVPAHCSSLAAVVGTASSTKVSWAA